MNKNLRYKQSMFVYNHQIIPNFARDKRGCRNRMSAMVLTHLPGNDKKTEWKV